MTTTQEYAELELSALIGADSFDGENVVVKREDLLNVLVSRETARALSQSLVMQSLDAAVVIAAATGSADSLANVTAEEYLTAHPETAQQVTVYRRALQRMDGYNVFDPANQSLWTAAVTEAWQSVAEDSMDLQQQEEE